MASTTTLSPDTAPPSADEPSPAPPADDDAAGVTQVLLVDVGDARLALPLIDVRAVVRGGRLIPLPGAPAWVPGLAQARGTLVPVADLAWLAAEGEARTGTVETADWRILVERGERLAFLAVDAVAGVESVDGEAAAPEATGPSRLPRCGAVRLQSQGAAAAHGAPATADVLDVGAVFRELFEED